MLSVRHSQAARANILKANLARRKPKIEMCCEHCDEPFLVFPCEQHRGRRFCSRRCGYAHMRGPDGAAAIQNRKARYVPRNKGTGTTERQSFRKAFSAEIERWRLRVYHRDGYACRECGDSRGGNLQAHHIVPWAKDKSLRFDVSNGITLCVDCHRKKHAGRAVCRICGRISTAEQYCGKHYGRYRKYGSPFLVMRKVSGKGYLLVVDSL